MQVQSFDSEIKKGKIVGYLKYLDKDKDSKTVLGLFIISDSKDSILSLNLPVYEYLDTTGLEYGAGFIGGDSVYFSYRNAQNDELSQFDYPPKSLQNPTFYRIESFTQVIITNINKITKQ
jgi:hypothetical protein